MAGPLVPLLVLLAAAGLNAAHAAVQEWPEHLLLAAEVGADGRPQFSRGRLATTSPSGPRSAISNWQESSLLQRALVASRSSELGAGHRANEGAPTISLCGSDADSASGPEEAGLVARATEKLCQGQRRELMEAWVEAPFAENFARLYGPSGWIDEAFVNYVAAETESSPFAQETELLIESVHNYSSRPIVVFDFGSMPCAVPHWTPERFPRLVLFRARPVPSDISFNFNKLRAMLLAKARTGVVVDSDQFVFRGADVMFERTRQEVGPAYPYPIMPVHWMSRDEGDAPGYRVYAFQCAGCPKRTMRWGHAHPTYTLHALPFIGELLAGELDNPRHVLGTHVSVPEDEDALNVGLWQVGATKQWCKFDVPFPSLFEMYAKGDAKGLQGCCTYDDAKWYPRGVPLMFYTAHGAKNTTEARGVLESIRNARGPQLYFDGGFYAAPGELPKPLPCLL